MISRRALAALIWGAVAVIAVQLAPTTVFAHGGHAHVSDSQVSGSQVSGSQVSGSHVSGAHISGAHVSGAHVSGAHGAGSTSTTRHQRATDHTSQLTTAEARATAEVASADRDDERGTAPACNGGCCTSGCSCCVPMTLAEPEAGWPLLANALDIIAPAPSTRAGIEPEAPAKPPKSIT
ncbi:MAG TPA: hypothetical protein VNC42_13330 [Bradyrhizobium sp.]|jgi:hypothetical protein|nr:hypothetical protein [Bradyrhizobium sp.]